MAGSTCIELGCVWSCITLGCDAKHCYFSFDRLTLATCGAIHVPGVVRRRLRASPSSRPVTNLPRKLRTIMAQATDSSTTPIPGLNAENMEAGAATTSPRSVPERCVQDQDHSCSTTASHIE